MATQAGRLRLRVTSMFMLSGLVGMLCGSGFGQTLFMPPPVQFTNNGAISGTLQTQGMTVPITGSLDFLNAGGTQRTKLVLSVPTGGQPGEVYNITQTSMTGGLATYSWTWAGTSQTAIAPATGLLVTVTGTTNGNGIFNVTDAPIDFVSGGPSSGTFTINGFAGTIAAAPETGQAQTFANYSWVTSTPTVTNEWEIASTDPTTCGKAALSGDFFVDFAGDLGSNSKTVKVSQCTAWQNPSLNQWSRECTVTMQGNKATLDILAVLSGTLLISLQENTTGEDMTDSLTLTVDSQGSFAPDSSVFNLPSICTPPNGNNQGNEGQCTGTLPSICLQ